MFRNLLDNLTKNQKIGLVVIGQVLVIVVLALLVQTFTREESAVEIEQGSLAGVDMPVNVREFTEENLWTIISSNVEGVDKNKIKDAVIREGTFETLENSDGSISASFIVDIDSLKQTYIVSTGWTKKGEILDMAVDCPPIGQMKYPETVCYGAYHNTYSLDLYLPYVMYPEGFDDDEAEPLAPNYMITGDEESKTLDILVSVCDVDKFKKEAWDYLKTVPIDFSNYTVNYEINSINTEC